MQLAALRLEWQPTPPDTARCSPGEKPFNPTTLLKTTDTGQEESFAIAFLNVIAVFGEKVIRYMGCFVALLQKPNYE